MFLRPKLSGAFAFQPTIACPGAAGTGDRMNLRTLMQTGPAKANELFARLSETSDGAIKTREKLFAELKTELELHASLEEQHLFPVLRRNAETKELVADAIKDNKELRAKIAELEALPKNDEAFPERLRELQKAFRQHAREEKREVLPAVQQALTEEQAQDLAGKIEARIADAEQARQEDLEQRRSKARHEREQAERQTEKQAESTPAQNAAAEPVRQNEAGQKQAKPDQERQDTEQQAAAKPVLHAAAQDSHNQEETDSPAVRSPQRNALRAVETAASEARGVSAGMREATERYVHMVRTVAPDPQDLVSLPRVAAGAITDIQAAWLDWMNQAALAGTRLSRELLRQTAEQQQRLVVQSMQRWMDQNARIMQVTMRAAQEGLRPFLNRSTAGQEERPPGQ
jgi:Hemerythrin HHE cation binding domain